MNDETPRPTENGSGQSGAAPEHYWSMEHYSYREPNVGSTAPAAPPPPPHRTARGRRNRLVAAAVLSVTLVAGAGSIAVAQASDDTTTAGGPDPVAAQVQPFDRPGDPGQGRGRGDRLGFGR